MQRSMSPLPDPPPAPPPATALAAARTTPALLATMRGVASAAAAEPAPIMENSMFCYQCEQTKNGTGCTTKGARALAWARAASRRARMRACMHGLRCAMR